MWAYILMPRKMHLGGFPLLDYREDPNSDIQFTSNIISHPIK